MTRAINQHYFDARKRIEEEKRSMYYVLGVLQSSYKCTENTYVKQDNSVSKTKYSQFKSRSKKLVGIIRKELESKHKITSDSSIRKEDSKRRHSYWFEAKTPDLCERLAELGLKDKKKRRFPIVGGEKPSDKQSLCVPKKYLRDFLRGLYDAKGYLFFHDPNARRAPINLELRLNPRFLKGLNKILHDQGIESKIYPNKLYLKHENAIKFRDFIYDGFESEEKPLYLPAKKRKFYAKKIHYSANSSLVLQTDKKIEKAKELLAKYSLAKVSKKLGYARKHSMNLSFKKRTGLHPGEYQINIVGRLIN